MNQRLPFVNPRAQRFTDKNIVIAGRDPLVDGAFHVGQDPGQQRDAGLPRQPVQTPETVVALACKALRQSPLISS